MNSLYSQRGVSAQKEEVHNAIRHLDQGLYPYAFCKLYPDFLGGDENWVNVTHADGAGTKSILAYLYWKETGDISVWKGIAQDAIIMNLDDLLCVGICDQMLFSSTVDRNKSRIPGEVLQQIIEGSSELFEELRKWGVNIHYLGGETADVGDLVRTIAVNGTLTARWPKNKVISNEKIKPGNVIVGFASYGRAQYETFYNSGIGSNGLTSARHDLLSHDYATNYPESFEGMLNKDVVYIGKNKLTDTVQIGEDGRLLENNSKSSEVTVGQLLLSPTRTFAPVVKAILDQHFDAVHGMIHCSGGGQTKCMKYLPGPMKIIKDNLFPAPAVFQLIQQSSGADDKEMYQVFNMGTRLEIFTDEASAADLINIAGTLGVNAQITGRVEASDAKTLVIKNGSEEIKF